MGLLITPSAPIDSPQLTGAPTAPTANVGTNTTQVATTEFVNEEISNDAPSKTGSGAYGTWNIDIDGNASTATKLSSAKTISLTGDVTGSVNTDLSGNASITATVVDDSHNHIISNVDGLQTALDAKAPASTTYSKTEVDNAISAVVTSLDWKEAVATYADIATTYPSPVEGWTVSVNDEDTIYRYNGATWVAITAGTIPMASETTDGKMSSSDFIKLGGIATGANNYTHPSGDGNMHVPATSTTNNGKVLKAGSLVGSLSWGTLTSSDVGLGNVNNTSDNNKPISTATQTALDNKIGIYAGAEAPTNTKQLWVDTDEEITNGIITLSITFNASSWSSGNYTISNASITSGSVITITPSSTITVAQYDAIAGAKIIENSISAGQVILKALGTVPTIDCPVVLIIEG